MREAKVKNEYSPFQESLPRTQLKSINQPECTQRQDFSDQN